MEQTNKKIQTKRRSLITTITDQMFSISLEKLIFLAFFNIFAFTLVFFLFSYFPGYQTQLSSLGLIDRFVSALYYSTSLSSNTGVGDLGTINLYKLLGSIEMVISIFLFAFVIAKITMRRSDELMANLYDMEMVTNFVNLREELFLARRRIDAIKARTVAANALGAEDKNLIGLTLTEVSSALILAPHILSDIGNNSQLNRNRQEFLVGMVRRTMLRMYDTLSWFNESGYDWKDEYTAAKLRECVEEHKKYQDNDFCKQGACSEFTASELMDSVEITDRLEKLL